MPRIPSLIVGLDPGYATQGLAVIDLKPTPRVVAFAASATDNQYDQDYRSRWQMEKAFEVLAPFASYGMNLPGMLVLEEFHASAYGKSPPMNAYYRGWYDCIFREKLAAKFQSAITVHPMHVRLWSGKFDKTPKKAEASTPEETLAFLLKIAPNLFDGQLRDQLKIDCLGKKQTAKALLVHAVDALVMAVMGVAAYVNSDWGRGRTPRQQAWIQKIHETYPPSALQDSGGSR